MLIMTEEGSKITLDFLQVLKAGFLVNLEQWFEKKNNRIVNYDFRKIV